MTYLKRKLNAIVLVTATFFTVDSSAESNQIHRDADQNYMEEVVISAPFQKSIAETSQPINVLAGEALFEKVANSLGATLAGELGINSASYGPSVGHPVIRGHTGNRVGILQNGVGTTDVANQSPDHAEGVDVSMAERIEIVRGPASLLYGSGAIGGVVNVIDAKIPERVPESLEVFVEQTRDSSNSENRSVLRLDAGSGNFAFHLEGFSRSNENVEVPGFAIDERAIHALEELQHAHDDEEEHEGEEEELENTRGFIGNSDAESSGGAFGLSFVGEAGFVGFSVSKLKNQYGLPPGSHSDAHEEGEEGEQHGEEEEVEFVRLDMDKTRYDIRSGLEIESGLIESVRFSFAKTDYEHDEIEFFETGETVVGTTYANEGYEGRLVITHRPTGAWSGVAGLQYTDNEFEAAGEEGFIPRSNINNFGLFAFEQYQGEQFTFELGLRYDSNVVETGSCESDELEISISGSVLYDIDDSSNVFLGLTNAARTPSVEELFANVDNSTCLRQGDNEDLVFHAATNLLEIGNPNLDPERSQNFELGYRYHSDRITGEISVYVNGIADYVFLNISGAEFEEQLLAEFTARDVTFRGVEAQLHFSLYESDRMGVGGSVFADSVRANFDAGGNVSLVPAGKFGGEIEVYGERWKLNFRAVRVHEQDKVGGFELPTDGYSLYAMYADYHWDVGTKGELKLFARADNLSDEEVRNHTTRLKNFAPEPGRSIKVGLRYSL